MRAALFTGLAALLLAATPASAGGEGRSSAWLLQARCIHVKEGAWTANTGNGYFGGMQFAADTWVRAGGNPDRAFSHPGDARYPFAASPEEQLYRAWVVWTRDGGTWRAWGAVGIACSAGALPRR
jgi:resuscitation-promoting factor RpfA